MRRLNYRQLFLARNPFPYVAVAPEKASVFFDQSGLINRVVREIKLSARNKRSNHIVLIGPYGSGKTHTLKYIEYLIEERKIGGRRALAVYIPHPGSSLVTLYRAVMRKLGYGWFFKVASQVGPKDIYASEVYRVISMLSEPSKEKSLIAWRWLLAENLGYDERKKISIGSNINDNNVNEMFNYLLRFIYRMGVRPVYLIIDEFETVNELDVVRRQRYYNSLRRLIDENAANLNIIIACTPSGWDEILEKAYPLARRLSKNVIYFESLTQENAIKIVSGYIMLQRVNKRKLRYYLKKIINDDLDTYLNIYPFTPDAISELVKLSHGNVGELLKLCSIVIDNAAMNGFKMITPDNLVELIPEQYR